MENDDYIRFRCTKEFKKKASETAERNGKTLSSFITDLIYQEVNKMKVKDLYVYMEDDMFNNYVEETGKEDTNQTYEEMKIYMKDNGFVFKNDLFIGTKSEFKGKNGNDILLFVNGDGEDVEIDLETNGRLTISKEDIVDMLKDELNNADSIYWTEEIAYRILNTDEDMYEIIDEVIDTYTKDYMLSYIKDIINSKINEMASEKIEWK